MKSIQNKLKSKDGVTLLIALVGFMVASMVCIVIVTAAVTSAQRVANDKKTNQAHLTLESAAQIVLDGMNNTTVTITTGKSTAYASEGEYSAEMAEAVGFVDTYGTDYSSSGSTPMDFTITLDGQTDTVKPVKVSFIMKKDDAEAQEKYKVIFTFSMENSEDELYLTMYPSKATPQQDTTVISWINGKISEVGSANAS